MHCCVQPFWRGSFLQRRRLKYRMLLNFILCRGLLRNVIGQREVEGGPVTIAVARKVDVWPEIDPLPIFLFVSCLEYSNVTTHTTLHFHCILMDILNFQVRVSLPPDVSCSNLPTDTLRLYPETNDIMKPRKAESLFRVSGWLHKSGYAERLLDWTGSYFISKI